MAQLNECPHCNGDIGHHLCEELQIAQNEIAFWRRAAANWKDAARSYREDVRFFVMRIGGQAVAERRVLEAALAMSKAHHKLDWTGGAAMQSVDVSEFQEARDKLFKAAVMLGGK